LRFIRPVRAASIRRYALDDLALLAVRVSILAFAAAAMAGPLLMTAARRRAWDARVITVRVSDNLAESLRAAVASLDRQPPARREIVVSSAFPIGSITQEDVAAVPAHIGLRFERSVGLPPTRTVTLGATLAGTAGAVRAVDREALLRGDATSVRDIGQPRSSAIPVDVVAPGQPRAAIDAAIDGALSRRMAAPPVNRLARIVFSPDAVQPADESSIREAWMADAAARILRDPTAARAHVRVAATSDRLLVVARARVDGVNAPALIRLVTNSLGAVRDRIDQETVAIPDAQLVAWTRPAGPAPAPRTDTIDGDDRRWFWMAALALLAIETWMRRARNDATAAASGVAPIVAPGTDQSSGAGHAEADRVA
jgi:hypothetical protein